MKFPAIPLSTVLLCATFAWLSCDPASCVTLYRGLMIGDDVQPPPSPEDNETFERVTSAPLSYERRPVSSRPSWSSSSAVTRSSPLRPVIIHRRKLIGGDARPIGGGEREVAGQRSVANLSSVVVRSPDLLITQSRQPSFNMTVV